MFAIWHQFDNSTRRSYGSKIFTITDSLSILMNVQMSQQSDQPKYHNSRNNIRFESKRLTSSSDIYFSFGDSFITLPAKALNPSSSAFGVTAIIFYGIRQYITPENDRNVYSNVISLKIGNNLESIQLNDPYKLELQMFRSKLNAASQTKKTVPKCVFWDFTTPTWLANGCTYSDSDIARLTCKCNHLTNFAIVSELPPPIDNPDKPNPTDAEEIANEIEEIYENITSVDNGTVGEWKESLLQLTTLIADFTTDQMIANVSRNLALRVTNSSLGSFNRLIEAPRIWNSLTANEQSYSSSRIFTSVANLGVLMNAKQNETHTVLAFSSIEMQSKLFTHGRDIHFQFQELQLTIPFQALNYSHTGASSDISREKNLIATSATKLKDISTYLEADNLLPNSPILSVTLENNRQTISLNHPNRLTFT